jgi:hypothetical protein
MITASGIRSLAEGCSKLRTFISKVMVQRLMRMRKADFCL